MSDDNAFRVRQILAEVRRLAVEYKALTGKPLGVTGEVAEHLAAEILGLDLADARSPGFDAIRTRDGRRERIQIKGRVIPRRNGASQRVGTIKRDAECDAVVLVLMDPDTFDALEIWEADMDAVRQRLAQPGSKARARGSLGVSEFRALAERIYP
ncbi:hypothetical protein SAMN05444722_0313 [Rhodovulum sp. ES.010]|uniref:DUF6998 domain-containing protein n=1 Tax=Rhodovulum sp. ES.010 TaxID=1882821 RepID=UPI0009275062|nr:hypothetical protein [Rhodovulum sp. ES.010]SIO07180.1 hypothetical protein SAMN05444722_0313 [Rhodovulum sp. ES.010]